jgi:hypothetical protein
MSIVSELSWGDFWLATKMTNQASTNIQEALKPIQITTLTEVLADRLNNTIRQKTSASELSRAKTMGRRCRQNMILRIREELKESGGRHG